MLRADDGIRTRDPHLGKVMLYQLSHVRAPPLAPAGAKARLETIAEPSGGVQTFPAASGLSLDCPKINFSPATLTG